MSFGSGGFSGFGQQGQQQQTGGFGSGAFGSNPTTGTGFGASNPTGAFGATQTQSGGGLFGSGGTSGGGFGGTGGTFGSSSGGAFGAAKPAFGSASTGGGGLFGTSTSTAGTSGFGGGGFGTTTASSTPFGGGGSSSLFGGTKPATSFGTTPATAGGTSLFGGGGGTSAFGGGSGSAFGATGNPGIGTNIGDPPGTAAVPFQPLQEKENTTSNQTNSFQNLLFMENYKKWSSDELRLVDYNQGRKHGSVGGTGSFGGMGTGFGGGFGTTAATQAQGGFGAGSGGTGLFGGQQATTSGFGQSAAGTGAFGASGGTSGGLFGAQNKPATSGLFGATAQPAQSTGLFGATGGTGGFGGTGTTGTAFGSSTGGGGLFGGAGTTTAPKQTGFSFGGQAAQTGGAFGGAAPSGGFGGAASTSAGSGLFGGASQPQQQQQQQQPGGGLFGSSAQQTTGGFGSGAFGSQQPQTNSGLFGQQVQKPGGLFGGGTTTTGGGLFGSAASTTTPFGGAPAAQTSSGLFGAKPAATGGGIFGSAPATQTGATGTGLFGGLGQTQTQPQQSSVFGGLGQGTQQKPSLFGAPQQQGGGGIFGGPTGQQGGLFGSSQQQQQQAPGMGSSLFGGAPGMQSTPQSLTTSLQDVSAYGTPSLFQGLGSNEIQNPGPLATPLSGSKHKTSRKNSILPLFKMTPGSAQKFVTPQKRGYGFSYSTFGTPTSPSSVASTPGALGQSLLGGSIGRGLGKSISSSNLRRTFNAEDSILAPGAFSASSGPRYYGGGGSVKKLVINRDIRSDLFSSPPTKDKQPAIDTRKLSKRVSFDTSVPAIENGTQEQGRQSPETPTNSTSDLGFLRPASRSSTNGVNGGKSTASDAAPEMEQVKGKELAIVHEEDSPGPSIQPAERLADAEEVDYWMRPSKQEIENMNRVQRQAVQDFTVGRLNMGQVRFRAPVDLTTINLDEIPGGIVVLQTRSATVYPISAKKPPVGKGLNVPAEISLEHSWPRGRGQEKSGPRVNKHIERLKKIENTEYISYDSHTGVWTFGVPHFTTYTCEFDDEETDAEGGEAHVTYPSVPSPGPDQEEDDTFDFRRKRRALPGAFETAEESDEEDGLLQGQSFLANRSTEYGSHVTITASQDDDMDLEDGLSENQDVATSSPRQSVPVEHQDSPYLGPVAPAQETPAGIMRARMRAIKESATPLQLQVAGGDDWMEMLQKTMSPQKRDRAALRTSIRANNDSAAGQGGQENAAEARGRMADGRGFATSIDLMNSLFEKARAPVQAPQLNTPAKGFMKWPYRRQNKIPGEEEASMAPLERTFHASFKPSWAPDGACIFATANLGSIAGAGNSTLDRVNVFTQKDLAAEDPLDGIVDHRDLVDVELVQGIPAVSTRRVTSMKPFSAFRENSLAQKSAAMTPISRQRAQYEQSVWELASVLFDPLDGVASPGKDRHRRESLAKFWAQLVQETTSKSVDQAPSHEEKAIVYLSQRKITEACRVLLDGKDLKVATMVSLIGTSDSFKKDMRDQVDEWHQGDVLSEFALPLRVIYSLLGGNVTICRGKKGVGIENRMDSTIISQQYDMDWKQAFGLRLWYGIVAEEGISAAVDHFLEDIEQARVPAPRPWYIEQRVYGAWEDTERDRREDLLWGLLKVFAGRCRLEDILQPENSQLSPFNFRLCWQLGQALGAVGRVKLPDNLADALTVSYSTEVVYHEKEGNWIAAIWILLHLTDATARTKAIQDVLAHHAGSLFTKEAKENNFYERLVDELKIPSAWVWQAAALYWRGKQNHSSLEAQCLLRASAFADAHRIFAKELAPKAVIEGNQAEIASMLGKLQPHQQVIPDWTLGGEVYGNFLEVLAHRQSGQPAPAAAIEALISSLPAMYEDSQESDAIEVAAITEMADVVAKEAMALANKGRLDLSKISRLPLTEDRHLRYSTDLAFAYFREVMSARG